MSAKSTSPLLAALLALMLVAAACGNSDSNDEASSDAAPTEQANVGETPTVEAEEPTSDEPPNAADSEPTEAPADEPTAVPIEPTSTSCDDIAALFVTKGSANPDLPDPFVEATCDGDVLTVMANTIPDYTYIMTSPGDPNEQDKSYDIPANPTMAAETTAVPLLGEMAVTLGGVPIYGPTEGTGGDVLSLGALSECGSHNGPTGFHLHLLGTSTTTDCIFTPEQVAAGPQLLGYAFDGYPIYSGNDQYTSSWELTDESLFASDTWSAHSYVCLLYTSPSPRDATLSRMPSSA